MTSLDRHSDDLSVGQSVQMEEGEGGVSFIAQVTHDLQKLYKKRAKGER